MTNQQRDALECAAGYIFTPMDMYEFQKQYSGRRAYYDNEMQGVWAPPETMSFLQGAAIMVGIAGICYFLHQSFSE